MGVKKMFGGDRNECTDGDTISPNLCQGFWHAKCSVLEVAPKEAPKEPSLDNRARAEKIALKKFTYKACRA